MNTPKTLKESWEQFAEICLLEATEQERRQAETAFYAGQFSLLTMMHKLSRDGVTPEQAHDYFDKWNQEAGQYCERTIVRIMGTYKTGTPH